jgi:signal transduction histidine kinase
MPGKNGKTKHTITIAGSTSVMPFTEKLAEHFMLDHPNFVIDVQGGGSTAGIQAVTNNTVNIGMSSRELNDKEKMLKSRNEELSQAYEELRAAQSQAIQVEKLATIGRLSAGVVHEINNPLDGIIRFTNMLLELQDNDSLPKDYLLEIKSGLSKIESVTRSLLQFSHHVNPKGTAIRNYVDVAKLVEEALIGCEARFRHDINVRRNISLHRRLLDMGLSQVFSSVIQNAFDAMPGGGTLDIEAAVEGPMVKIGFRDSGSGIPDGFKERIFEPFYTDKNTSERPGLGLSKCREIIERYNGTIRVESVPGSGSVFTIAVPEKFLERG